MPAGICIGGRAMARPYCGVGKATAIKKKGTAVCGALGYGEIMG